jgi:two-component system, LytTR family, sensor kinase
LPLHFIPIFLHFMDERPIPRFSRLFYSMTRFVHRFRWHILFWSLYCIGWTWFSVSYYHSPVGVAALATLAWFLGQSTLIYLNIYRWVPRLLKPRRIGLFILALLATILATALFTATAITWIMNTIMQTSGPKQASPKFGTWFFYVVSGNFYWGLLAVGFTIIRDRLRNDRRNLRLEKEHTENELRFLKSQMNPHFLFNAINSIYVLIRKDPDLAEHTLARFSDMLRYQLYDCATDFIPIEKEITYLENYMRLEQLRKGSMLILDYEAEGTVQHFSVAPLLLMPLVENAFKYVSSFPDRENKVRVWLSFDGSQFEFGIGNTVDEFTRADDRSVGGIGGVGGIGVVGGIGLENVRRRLELLYPRRHSLTIDASREYYSVTLKLLVK